MAIVTEDGTGKSDAQSYLSLADADAYFTARGVSAWTGSNAVKEAALIADRLSDGKPGRVVVVAAVHEGKPTLVAKAGPDAVKNGAHAGNLVKALA